MTYTGLKGGAGCEWHFRVASWHCLSATMVLNSAFVAFCDFGISCLLTSVDSFLIEGVATVGIGLFLIIFLPNKPDTTRWLTPVQRECLVHDLEIDRAQKDNSSEYSVGKGFMMCLTDIKTYLLMSVLFCTYISAAVTNFVSLQRSCGRVLIIAVSQCCFDSRLLPQYHLRPDCA